jgi:bifunctional non-homologous end joining protein LigD
MSPAPDASLAEYARKRDFDKTTEPVGSTLEQVHPLYVIQRHEARRLHYDLRLEIGGVLVSWAVPQGPSLDPAVRRLAILTEDHPMDYGSFEGVIPKGEYGGGTVVLWDRGVFVPLDGEHRPIALPDEPERIDRAMKQAYKKGRIRFWLHGERLHGGWALVRTKDDSWLLIKMRDARADPVTDVTEDTRSVVTGRTSDEVRRDEGTPEELARRKARRTREGRGLDRWGR